MVNRFYGYQYDTNPRKLSHDNAPYNNNKYPRKDESINDKNGKNTTRNKQNSSNKRNNNRHSKYKNPNSKTTTRDKEQFKVRENKVSKSNRQQVINSKVNVQNNIRTKNDIKPKLKIVALLITGFSVLFAISYQNSLISESFNRKEQYRKEMEALSKTNQQIEVGIENSLNLKNIEDVAKEKLGMQKLNNSQKIYVSLPKEDYVAPATEQIVMEEDLNFFQKLIRGFTKSIK